MSTTTISVSDIEAITRAIETRQTNFGEELHWSVGVVLMNYGDRFTSVSCIGGEWSGNKAEIIRRTATGLPLCPDGHPLMEGAGRKVLALVDEVEQ